MKKKILSLLLVLVWLVCLICMPVTAETADSRATHQLGDFDNNGVVDNRDVEYLLWHTLFPEDYPLSVAGDFDHSQQVDNKDVEYLLWHTLYPSDYPLTEKGESSFQVYFIDVGQADAALIICDDKTMLIDGGNAADSNLMYSFLQNKGITKLDYVIGTHAHEDHIGGLTGALNYAKVDKVYCAATSYNTNAFKNFANAVKKQGKAIVVPSVGLQFNLGSASCTVLAVNTTSDINNTSIVLRIVYGQTSFLFTGDAEKEVEQSMLDRGVTLKSTVLKVGHHGSYTSSSYQFLRAVQAEYAVISCGQGNDYGHPHDQVLSRLKNADLTLFRTDLQGDIMCTSDGKTVSFSVTRNLNANVFQ